MPWAALDLANRFAGPFALEEKFAKGDWQGGRDRPAGPRQRPHNV
ncbi:hypothetical protein BN2476_650046 [Paraburkholderia piptadeniae]|uniref:Uncharacterized protein n=1 Tax=Paraburkholderia piptadeniae TaxID=1701573 RepID=A0A1N7SN83_9BURK|nr:hypothetical protein BN2476_650046 [Paraburkholderia piptadeniae]